MTLRWRQVIDQHGNPHELARRGRLEFLVRPIGMPEWVVYTRLGCEGAQFWRPLGRSTATLYGARRLAESYR